MATFNGSSHMILQRFIQLGHYIGVVPFFISCDSPLADHAKATSSRIVRTLQVVNGALLSMGFVRRYFGTNMFGKRDDDFIRIPSIAHMTFYVLWILYTWTFTVVIWRKKDGFQKLLEQLGSLERLGHCQNNGSKCKPINKCFRIGPLWKSVIPYILIALIVLGDLQDLVFVVLRVHEHGVLEALLKYEHSIGLAMEQLGMRCLPSIRRFLAAAVLVTSSYSYLVTLYADMLCFCAALAFYLVVKMTLPAEKFWSIQKWLTLKSLHRLSETLNETIGYFVFFSAAFFLPHYSYKIHNALKGDLMPLLGLTLTSGPYFGFFILSAWAHSLTTARHGCELLCYGGNDLLLPRVKMKALIIASNLETGIRGRVFLVTYSLVGNFVALVVTYSVAILQSQE